MDGVHFFGLQFSLIYVIYFGHITVNIFNISEHFSCGFYIFNKLGVCPIVCKINLVGRLSSFKL